MNVAFHDLGKGCDYVHLTFSLFLVFYIFFTTYDIESYDFG
jgi:hypothetical protein